MKMILACRTTGAPGGTNATMLGHGFFISGGLAATANSGLQVTFGGTSAAYDHSVTSRSGSRRRFRSPGRGRRSSSTSPR
jgi:hypothetical protein